MAPGRSAGWSADVFPRPGPRSPLSPVAHIWRRCRNTGCGSSHRWAPIRFGSRQQSVAALVELAAVAPPETPIVRLQNGIANEPAALRLFPHVYAVSVACPTSHLEPGVVQAWSAPVTGLLDTAPFGANIAGGLQTAFQSSYTGNYVWHCHILEHEDNDMMQRYVIA